MFETGKSPATIVQEKGLAQVSDTGAIEKFCDEAIAANPNPVPITRPANWPRSIRSKAR
jgi:aspartyl-tRNA(Asn)/glutamyl-tRNA(Gln) amidotransferase subunit B